MTEKCSSCEQMKKENASLRKSISDFTRNYTEVINENLALRRVVTRANLNLYKEPELYPTVGEKENGS